MSNTKLHWDEIYRARLPDEMSWTEDRPSLSLQWILEWVTDRSLGIIDVGGGMSLHTDRLLSEGYQRLAVLDISAHALERAQAHLGDRKSKVEWIHADVTAFKSTRLFHLWHDRAMFHFLMDPKARAKYAQSVHDCLSPGGWLILSTFAPDGPSQCSELDVTRFDEDGLTREIGTGFTLIRSQRAVHRTPWGSSQNFQHCLFQKW